MESIPIFLALAVVVTCFLVLVVLSVQFILRKHLSRASWIICCIALLSIIAAAAFAIGNAGTEYNPANATFERIAGRYSNGDALLILRTDGTYSALNLNGLTSGTWSHFDWNLTFSGSTLEHPRWITRRGKPAILPYYSGPDGSDGLPLTKE